MIPVRRRISADNGVHSRHGGAAPILPGPSPVGVKPLLFTLDGGHLTSGDGVLVLAGIERHLGVADRLARCLENPRALDHVRHGLAEMIRLRTLMIATGYADANDRPGPR